MATMLIETGKIREYARATGSTHPEYLGRMDSPIPPTFLATVVFWQDLFGELQKSSEIQEALAHAGIGYDARNLLSLAQEYVFHGPPPHAGDTLETELRFDGVEEKQSRRGTMLMVLFTVLFHRGDGTTAAECHYTSGYFANEGADR
jgi:hypothetical protein